MTHDLFAIVPEAHRDAARSAVDAALGAVQVDALTSVPGGASAALTYCVEVGGRPYLLRMETRRDAFRNPHQYACMQAAAAAGIAPPVRYADDAAGVALIDFVAARPLAEYPGGPMALAAGMGDLARRLQATPTFPFLAGYLDIIDQLLGLASTRFAPGLLAPHVEGFQRIREVYPWDPDGLVASHNDPNPSNILFDGARLWLIDWETAYANDPLVDVAILANNHAATPDLEAALLEAWVGRAPDRMLKARLTLMRQLVGLYYAALIFTVATPAGAELYDSLEAPDHAAFQAAVSAGKLSTMGPNPVVTLGLVYLNAFQAGATTPAVRDALAVVRGA